MALFPEFVYRDHRKLPSMPCGVYCKTVSMGCAMFFWGLFVREVGMLRRTLRSSRGVHKSHDPYHNSRNKSRENKHCLLKHSNNVINGLQKLSDYICF